MKISPELAAILKRAVDEVKTWEPWQRSTDPQGAKSKL
jgi:hypothetical protein